VDFETLLCENRRLNREARKRQHAIDRKLMALDDALSAQATRMDSNITALHSYMSGETSLILREVMSARSSQSPRVNRSPVLF